MKKRLGALYTRRTHPCIWIECGKHMRLYAHRHVYMSRTRMYTYMFVCVYNIWLNVKQKLYTEISKQSRRREFNNFFSSFSSFVCYFPQQYSQYHWIVVVNCFLIFCNSVSASYRELFDNFKCKQYIKLALLSVFPFFSWEFWLNRLIQSNDFHRQRHTHRLLTFLIEPTDKPKAKLYGTIYKGIWAFIKLFLLFIF